MDPHAAATLIDWRLRVADLYAQVRADDDHERGHATWRAGRDELFRTHDQSPLPAHDPLRETGLPVWPYDPRWRLEAVVEPLPEGDGPDEERGLDTGDDGSLTLRRIGRAELPDSEGLDVWRMHQYAGGLFVPLKDGTSGTTTYGAGRYLLDTAKGSWLGGGTAPDGRATIVLDLNFAYHPSCRYDDRWRCPLASPGNTITSSVEVGERLDRQG